MAFNIFLAKLGPWGPRATAERPPEKNEKSRNPWFPVDFCVFLYIFFHILVRSPERFFFFRILCILEFFSTCSLSIFHFFVIFYMFLYLFPIFSYIFLYFPIFSYIFLHFPIFFYILLYFYIFFLHLDLFGPTGTHWGPNWAQLGPNGAQIGPMGPIGAQLGPNGAHWGPKWAPNWAQLGPKSGGQVAGKWRATGGAGPDVFDFFENPSGSVAWEVFFSQILCIFNLFSTFFLWSSIFSSCFHFWGIFSLSFPVTRQLRLFPPQYAHITKISIWNQ